VPWRHIPVWHRGCRQLRLRLLRTRDVSDRERHVAHGGLPGVRGRDFSEQPGRCRQRLVHPVRYRQVSDRPGHGQRIQLPAVCCGQVRDWVGLSGLPLVPSGQVPDRRWHCGSSRLLPVRSRHIPVWERPGVRAQLHAMRGWQVPDGLPHDQRDQLHTVLGRDVRERMGICQLLSVLGWGIHERSWLVGLQLV